MNIGIVEMHFMNLNLNIQTINLSYQEKICLRLLIS